TRLDSRLDRAGLLPWHHRQVLAIEVNEAMTLQQENRRLSRRLAVVALIMFGFAFALVTFFNQICLALRINIIDHPSVITNTQVDTSRTITIEFDSNTHDLPWRFRPLVSYVKVHPGELTTIEYEIVNV